MQNKRKDGLAKKMGETVITKILATRGSKHNRMIEKLCTNMCKCCWGTLDSSILAL